MQRYVLAWFWAIVTYVVIVPMFLLARTSHGEGCIWARNFWPGPGSNGRCFVALTEDAALNGKFAARDDDWVEVPCNRPMPPLCIPSMAPPVQQGGPEWLRDWVESHPPGADQ